MCLSVKYFLLAAV